VVVRQVENEPDMGSAQKDIDDFDAVAEIEREHFVVEADESLGNRIRRAKGDKLPYVLVVGDDDVAAGTVGVNPRGNEVERGVSVDAFVSRLLGDVANRV